jgi:hypothetical protein
VVQRDRAHRSAFAAGCEKPQRAAPLDRTMTVARLGTDQGTDALLVKMNSVVLFKIKRWYEIHFLDLNANALHSTVSTV